MKTLVVAEKPGAGKDIARILGCTESHGDYIESDKYIVTWAVGHLIERKDPEDVDVRYKTWRLEDLPVPTDNGLKVKGGTSSQFEVIKKLIHRPDVERLVNAGDAGREGLMIQEWIYREAGNDLPVDILWASSLTDEAITTAFRHLHSNQEMEFQSLLKEAECRSEADQKYGYNYTRMLTLLFANRGTVLSYGRCQTPLLNLIVIRDREFEKFESSPFWQVEATYQKGFASTLIDSGTGKTKCFLDKSQAEHELQDLSRNHTATVIEYKTEEKEKKAPTLYNLADLQTVMGKKYGFTPDKTLAIAQRFYETYKILSYPRTDSRYLSDDLYGEIGAHLQSCNFKPFCDFIEKIDLSSFQKDKAYFNNNKVSDHHALIPTIKDDIKIIYQKLSEEERNCWNEIVCRFVAIFMPPYRYEVTEIKLLVGEKIFASSGTTIKDLGYRKLSRIVKEKEDTEALQMLPIVSEGEEIEIAGIKLKEGKTKPPQRYGPGNIISLMKKYKIGTSATSASIITSLQDRGFIKLEHGKYISTDLGRQLIEIVPQELKHPNLTIAFEEELKKVNVGELSKEEFLDAIDRQVIQNLSKFQNRKIDSKLGTAKESLLCPQCGKPIRQGKTNTGKVNWYCTGYAAEPPCEFRIWQEVCGKKLTEEQVSLLIKNGRTQSMQGFVSKKTGKKFTAALLLKPDENGAVEFIFPVVKKGNRGK